MSRRAQPVNPPWGYHGGNTPIVPTKHDVLSGRGVNIAQHAGNERFRALVNSRYDANYCSQYTTTEKRAVAREIIGHIQSLNPPGRFLKRLGRSKNSRGLEGPWEELSDQDAIKKTCQALRDCNRHDRTGYAATVAVPDDVRHNTQLRSSTGLSNKQYAEQAAAVSIQIHRQQTQEQLQQTTQEVVASASAFSLDNLNNSASDSEDPKENLKRPREEDPTPLEPSSTGEISPSEPYTWLKKQRFEGAADTTPLATTTPTTAASSGGILHDTSLLDSVPSSAASHPEHHDNQGEHPIFLGHEQHAMPPSPPAHYDHHLGAAFADTFVGDIKPSADHHDLEPLHLAESAIHSTEQQYGLLGAEDVFPPPSPLHPTHHHHYNTNHGGLAHDHFQD